MSRARARASADPRFKLRTPRAVTALLMMIIIRHVLRQFLQPRLRTRFQLRNGPLNRTVCNSGDAMLLIMSPFGFSSHECLIKTTFRRISNFRRRENPHFKRRECTNVHPRTIVADASVRKKQEINGRTSFRCARRKSRGVEVTFYAGTSLPSVKKKGYKAQKFTT